MPAAVNVYIVYRLQKSSKAREILPDKLQNKILQFLI